MTKPKYPPSACQHCGNDETRHKFKGHLYCHVCFKDILPALRGPLPFKLGQEVDEPKKEENTQ
jgi:hypothetical protein